MTTVVVTAKVEDVTKWEEGFRTYGEHFKNFLGVTSPIRLGIAINDGNEVAAYFEPADVSKFMSQLDTPENVAAMECTGVKKDTVKVYVMDRTFQP